MSENTRVWEDVTDPQAKADIDKATSEVLANKRPSGPPASGSAGVPWGGSGAERYWLEIK